MADEIVKTKKYDNCIIRTHIPIRTAEEEEKHRKQLYEATVRFAKAMYRAEMEKETEKRA